jgi:hypothetical protein
MENKLQELDRALCEFIAILDSDLGIDSAEGGVRPDHPHTELIDFDRLRRILDETAVALREALQRERQAEVVRKWLISRITAMRRGRKAILLQHRAGDVSAAILEATLPELLRLFEDESAGLRRLSTTEKSLRGIPSEYKRNKYLPYKS